MKKSWNFWESLKRCFPIAAVEFGILCGPSMASGAYATNYFSKWGPQGIWMILFWMLLMVVSVFCGMYFASAFGVHNYSEFYREMYGKKIYKYAAPVLDIYALFGGIIAEAAQCTLGGVMFNTLFGWHPLVGASLMAIVIIVLMLWGDEIVRRGAAIMTFVSGLPKGSETGFFGFYIHQTSQYWSVARKQEVKNLSKIGSTQPSEN